MKTNLLLTLALMSLTAGSAVCEDQPQKAARLDVQIKVQMDYLVYLPPDYDKQEKLEWLLAQKRTSKK